MDFEQVGEIYVTVTPPGRSGKNCVKHAIVTYRNDNAGNLSDYILEGEWCVYRELTGKIEEITDLTETTMNMIFPTITNETVELYWAEKPDDDLETFNAAQQTTFEFVVLIEEKNKRNKTPQ